MNIITEEGFMRQMFCSEVTDGALQFTLLHISAPKTLAFLPIDLDKERIDALRLRSVATPESIRRACHQTNRLKGTKIGLELFIYKELRGTNGGDEVSHSPLNLWLLGQTLEAERLIRRADLRHGISCSVWLKDSTRTFSRRNFRVERRLATVGETATTRRWMRRRGRTHGI